MVATGSDGSEWLLVVGAALLGLILSPAAEILIAKCLPRLGGLPRLSVRITTAAVTGIACLAFTLRFGITFGLPAFLFFAVVGVQLARIDVSLHLLPNPLILVLLAGGLPLLLVPAILNQHADNLLRALAGVVVLFGSYLVLGLISPKSIGMGDVKLAAPIGLYLGYLGWQQLLFGGLLGFILNGLVTVALLNRKSRKTVTEVAHGPSMLGATAAVTLFLL
ncbi:prepilin peptidase [Pseudarthrobacter sp. B4EP4b]|uniref:prepilin peptidase n=1 Tax=Pseudarthrobacter sp. B4EP4b TaxID=2590664 RepID=UPI001152AF1C|nr:prepilin peptidase [Pseudarthrobacter sp. B4EP4b]